MNIQYTAAVYDSSGYAEAARNYICALLGQGVKLTIKPISFESWRTDLGPEFQKILPYVNKALKPDINLVHLTPENFPRCKVEGIKNVGITVWETSKIPSTWVPLCNQMDEIWVPCQWNKTVFQESGVTVPVKVLPHTLNLASVTSNTKLSEIPSDVFNFYSIFQWSSRKNPEGLIAAYLSEFKPTEKVNLVLKTYLSNNTNADRMATIDAIAGVKRDLQLHDVETAPMQLVHGGLSKQTIIDLHNSCDCFVLPHRAEGWGVPHFEAMMMGKPVITTGFSGNLEFMNGNTSYLLSFNMTPVRGMGRPTYNGFMDWAEPNIDNLRYYMRHVFEHREEAKEKARRGIDFISKFDWPVVGKQMMELING